MDIANIKREYERIDPQIMRNIARRCFKSWEDMRDNQKELYYYTDLNALLNGILMNNDKICLWASRWSHLNDPTEIKLGLEELRNQETPNDVVNAAFLLAKLNHSISYSMHRDTLSMWKMYGDSGNGAMLIFDTKALVNQWGGLIQPCIYNCSQQFTSVNEMLFHPEFHPEIEQLSDAKKTLIWYHLLQMYISILKNDDYLYEKEVRLIVLGAPHFYNEHVSEQKFRLSKGKIIPYVEVFISKESLKGICLGPLVDSSSKETLEEFLHIKGYDDVVVTQSKIHYQ